MKKKLAAVSKPMLRSGRRPRRRRTTPTGCTRSEIRTCTRMGACPVRGNRAVPRGLRLRRLAGHGQPRGHPLRAEGQAVEDPRRVHAPGDHAAAPADAAGDGEGRRARPVRGLALRQERHAADHGEGGCSTSAPTSATPGRSGATTRSCCAAGRAAARCRFSTRRRPRSRASPTRRPAIRSNLKDAKLIPADAMIFQAAHLSRAHMLFRMDRSLRDR